MKILEKTINEMPNSFTSQEFNKRAIKNGYPAKNLKIKGLSTFIRKYADNAYKGSKTWVKRSAKEKISKVAETQQFNRFAVSGSAIRPPLGLIPKKFHEERVKVERFNEVCGAIARYYEAGLKINSEWIEEYNELVESVGKHYR